MYQVQKPDKENWIFIFSEIIDEPDEFVVLVKAYRDMLHSKIIKVSDMMQYRIENDPLNLIFQWDDCFGITVVVPKPCDSNQAFHVLCELCDTLNTKAGLYTE